MNDQKLQDDLESNVRYQMLKIDALFRRRTTPSRDHFNDHLHPVKAVDQDNPNAILNQALSDALLNAMATLIDYYCVYTVVRIGGPLEKILDVQHHPLNNAFLVSQSRLPEVKNDPRFSTLLSAFNAKYSRIEEAAPDDYWMGLLGHAIAARLNKFGVLKCSTFEPDYDEPTRRLQIDTKIKDYYFLMRPLFSNRANPSGLKYAIYTDINNFLKHNTVPYLSIKTENFGDERRIFSYFKIHNEYSVFLRNGILKDLVKCPFDDLKSALAAKHADRWEPCSLEEIWGMGPILTTDKENGYLSEEGKCLNFFVDGVLLAKTASETMIDAVGSLKITLQKLVGHIKDGLDLRLDSET